MKRAHPAGGREEPAAEGVGSHGPQCQCVYHRAERSKPVPPVAAKGLKFPRRFREKKPSA